MVEQESSAFVPLHAFSISAVYTMPVIVPNTIYPLLSWSIFFTLCLSIYSFSFFLALAVGAAKMDDTDAYSKIVEKNIFHMQTK